MGIFDQIKNAFTKGEAEAPPEKDADPAAEAVQSAEPDAGREESYTVQSGDTLWKIADQVYGDGEQYLRIYEANDDQIESPDRILPGQVLRLP
jgi:nucleoid-associated protein YgaU